MRSRAERRRDRHRQWFHQYEVEYFIRREYPGCPEFAVVYFANYICTTPKNWRGAAVATAVEATLQNELRHRFTDYDQLMLVGVRRKEARRRVQPKINAMIAAWRKRLVAKPVAEKADPKVLLSDDVIIIAHLID